MGNLTSTVGAAFTPSDAFFLCEATRTGSLDIVRLFLKKNPALVYATDASEKSTPWHVAATAGHDVVVRVLIDTTRANAVSNNFDPLSRVINKQNAKGQTPLMLACGGGHSVCVRLLLESGAHLLIADATGRSALHYAALHCRWDGKGNDCVELLLAHMQQQLIAQGPTAAPPSVHANVIRKFADTGDMYGRTALHCAAWSGNTRAVHALWAVGADICARTDADCYDAELPCNNGTTPLHFAAMRGHQPVVVLLLAAWHRMATRPGAPLPRPTFFRAVPPSRARSTADLGGTGSAPAAQAAGSISRPDQSEEQQPELADEQTQGEELREGEPSGSAAGGAGTGSGPGTEAATAAGRAGDTAGAAGRAGMADGGAGEASRSEGQRGPGIPTDGDAGTTQEGLTCTVSVVSGGAAAEGDRAAASGKAPVDVGIEGAAAATASSAASSEGGHGSGGGGGGGGSTRSQSVRSLEVLVTPLVELPRPPSPRPPALDPRLMVDAYGMTPYSIAGKREQERGSMLVELLDPATDFGAEESEDDQEDEDDSDDSDAAEDMDGRSGGTGADGRSTGASSAAMLGRRRRRRRQQPRNGRGRRPVGQAYGGDADAEDSDVDSEAAAAGPLLLWEGVELVQDIANDPEGFFRLQQTVSLLQPQLLDEEEGSRGRRSSGGGGSQPDGRVRPPAQVRVSVTTDVVPDCFLCPLTCKVLRDPVVAADGVTYEREAIERHLRHVSTSPVTKQRLASKQLYDNSALRGTIEQWSAGLLPPPPPSGPGRSNDARRPAGTGLLGRP